MTVVPGLRIFITGATGLLGRRLVLDRVERGDHVVVLSRSRAGAEKLFATAVNPAVEVVEGDPSIPGDWQRAVDGCDAVVHLAGAPVAGRRWSARHKRELVRTRVDSTFQVVEAIRVAAAPPRVLVCASAVGWYGETGDRERDEEAPARPGDFLADLVIRWEGEARKAEALGVRVVPLRFGIVLDTRGGALPQIVRPFRWFVGGPVAGGRQYMPWIHWRDVIGIADLALRDPAARGPINCTAPNPVRNREFSRTLGRVIGRPSWLPVPLLGLRLVLGELGRYAGMSQRVVPTRARKLGYHFVYPELGPALESLLGRASALPSAPPGALPGAPPGAPPAARAQSPRTPGAEAGPMPGTPIRLVAVSVDGALLRRDGRLAQGVVQACRAAQRAGCLVVLATARPPRSVKFIVRTLDLHGPMVNYNGAVIWNPIDDRPQYHEGLPGAIARSVIDAAREVEPDLLVGIEVLDRWFTDRIDPTFAVRAGVNLEPDGIGPLDRYLDSPVTQLNLFGAPASIAAVRPRIEEAFWRTQHVSLFQPEPTLLQIMHPLVDKGIALQRIAQRSRLDRASVMAIGDGLNDLGMMEWAAFAVAMGDAAARVRDLADAIVPSNDDNGVAVAIRRFVLARIMHEPGRPAGDPIA